MFPDSRFLKIGMIGYSFGGYLVARAAAVSKKLDACVLTRFKLPQRNIELLTAFYGVFSALTNKKGRPGRNLSMA